MFARNCRRQEVNFRNFKLVVIVLEQKVGSAIKIRGSGIRRLPRMMTKTTQIFTIHQARAMLPLLRLIVTDISLSHRELTERKSNLRRMLRRHEGKARFQVYDAEIVEIQEDLKNETAHLDDYVSELEQLGVILRSAHDGIVDFPAVIDHLPAFYTWQMEQADVQDYHWADESTADRKPIHD
jgi:hypothetical protein